MTSMLRRRLTAFVLVLLAIELLDELVYGAREAAWPLIRDDLHLSYLQIGILLSVPNLIGHLIEPALGILGDVWKRRLLILGGGVWFGAAAILVSVSQNFIVFLLAEILSSPASGAFVGLSQAALMDHEPERHEQNMARWELAGSLGQVVSPFLLGAAILLGGSWRSVFFGLGLAALLMVVVARRFPFGNGSGEAEQAIGFRQGVKNALAALRRKDVLRWLILLHFSDLMLDILLGYIALYFVDVVGVNEAEAGIAVAVWTGVGIIGDILLIPLLERVRGLSYLRVSAAIEFVLFIGFLVIQPVWLKFVLLGLHGFFNAGWYSILQAQLYSAMPGQSATVMTVGNITGLAGSLIPLVLGFLADRWGLGVAIWFLLLGPIALLIGLPRKVIGSSSDAH